MVIFKQQQLQTNTRSTNRHIQNSGGKIAGAIKRGAMLWKRAIIASVDERLLSRGELMVVDVVKTQNRKQWCSSALVLLHYAIRWSAVLARGGGSDACVCDAGRGV